MRKIAVFGAASEIARETAKFFAGDGAALFLVGRNEEKLKIIAADLMIRGASKADYCVADLNEEKRHECLIQEASDALSGLDTVLIAHGTLSDQKVCQTDFKMAETELKTNFLSAVSLLTIVANQFEKQKKGCIAVITSVAGD
ncbi:MAG: SDR family NAD(P)-dependent oxidoreductase, partial [Candidatus Omnitrophica bacterium]|nr:SDR family NAD(P)-dependent oxidoreductase [Candidatus Omnitrophota bacterium]